jgi:hypothetical protein
VVSLFQQARQTSNSGYHIHVRIPVYHSHVHGERIIMPSKKIKDNGCWVKLEDLNYGKVRVSLVVEYACMEDYHEGLPELEDAGNSFGGVTSTSVYVQVGE